MVPTEIPASSAPQPIEVFCSYSHKDEALRDELDTHLNILQSHGVIASWHDHAIPAGKQWADEIDEHLNSAQIILLLISPDFLASKYCREVEVKRAMERHAAGEARVISIMLRDVDWHGSPLSKLQALPKNARAVTMWPDRDQAFKDIAIGIRKVAEDLRRPATRPKHTAEGTAGGVRTIGSKTTTLPPLDHTSPLKKFAVMGVIAFVLLAALGYFALHGHTGRQQPSSFLQPGQYLGGIDLGSKGTKGALFTVAKGGDAKDAQVIYRKSINTVLVGSMQNAQFTQQGMQDATDAVQELLNEMHALAQKNKVTVVAYYVVASSGVAKGTNKDALARLIKTRTGLDLDFVDSKREGYFGMASAVPVDKQANALYLDIGSGNTKLGCDVGGTDLSSYRSEEVPYGSVTARNQGRETNSADIWAGIQQVMRDKVGPTYQEESMNTPCLRSREEIYWTGGAAWATASFMHPEGALDAFVTISKHDVDTFLSRLRDGSWNQGRLEYTFAKDVPPARQEEIRKQAESEKDDVVNRLASEDLFAGVSIMKTVLGFSNPSAKIQFVRDSNYIYGYALEKYERGSGSVGGK